MSAEINERISSWFEPTPAWSKWDHAGMYWQVSDGGCWLGYRDDPSDVDEEIERRPVDYFTDESANARLLEAMPQPRLQLEYPLPGLKTWECVADIHSPDATAAWNPDRMKAVVDAFLKFANLSSKDGAR